MAGIAWPSASTPPSAAISHANVRARPAAEPGASCGGRDRLLRRGFLSGGSRSRLPTGAASVPAFVLLKLASRCAERIAQRNVGILVSLTAPLSALYGEVTARRGDVDPDVE